jgi:uncharacterized membrane protein required for colicin V production
MNWVDSLIGIILGVNIFNGLRRGLVASLFDNISLIVAIIGSWRWGTLGIELFTETLHLPPFIADVFSYGLTGIAIYCVCALLGAIIHKITIATLPVSFDVFGGGILGAVKGILFASIIFIPLVCTTSLPIDVYTALQESKIIE